MTEKVKVTCCHFAHKSQRPCPHCLVPMDELGEIDRDYPFRTRASAEEKLSRIVELYQSPGGKAAAKREAQAENWLCVKVCE